MREEWLAHCIRLSAEPADLYSGCRKILRNRTLSFSAFGELTIGDSGYSERKLTLLNKLYLHQESRDMALQLWERRLGQKKYGSVGFTTYNHLLKSDPNKGAKRASVMGPCVQSIVLTSTGKQTCYVDIFYRTTELLKKFPADLVFIRDDLMPGFDLTGLQSIDFHFANVTVHPMYVGTILPLFPDPLDFFRGVKTADPYFWGWAIKWTARYACDEHHRGIAKFSQALRVKQEMRDRMDDRTLERLARYVRRNHPGHSREYVDPEEDE